MQLDPSRPVIEVGDEQLYIEADDVLRQSLEFVGRCSRAESIGMGDEQLLQGFHPLCERALHCGIRQLSEDVSSR